MDCPVCKNAMITMELDDVEIDHCLGCGGIWLDAGELELLMGQGDKAKEFVRSFSIAKGCREKPRKCPICLKKMEKVTVGNQVALLDRCRKGHGLWFDKGELNGVATAAGFKGAEKLKNVLADMFNNDDKK